MRTVLCQLVSHTVNALELKNSSKVRKGIKQKGTSTHRSKCTNYTTFGIAEEAWDGKDECREGEPNAALELVETVAPFDDRETGSTVIRQAKVFLYVWITYKKWYSR